MRYAEDANYWQTTIYPVKSQAEILELLEHFGVDSIQMTQGKASGRFAWLIRFQWSGATYRFVFTPLKCKYPDKVLSRGGKRRKNEDQAKYQMGRIAYFFVKALLTAAEAQPAALFGFVELPAMSQHVNGLPMTAAEVGVEGVTGLLPELPLQLE